MFVSYVSEASPGYRYVLGTCEQRGLRDGRDRRDGTRLIAHTEYYCTPCAITATSRRPIFSPDLLRPLGFYFDLLARLISAKNRWILPKSIKESVDLPDFVKESVAQIQILCTF